MKRIAAVLLLALALGGASLALGEEVRIAPQWEVPDYVTWLLEVASGEVGYREGPHGYSKYGEWAGDPYAQWCAEYLDWCVDQVDKQRGTQLLNTVYPLYNGTNTGRNWFIRQGRYIVHWGNLDGWGYQWMRGDDAFITRTTYIPQPGDWVFFTWTSTLDTDHVAMVEYCTRDENGQVTIHVLEGNTPVEVKRATYDLDYKRILGFGTVHDVADWTMRSGNRGEKVRQLQEKLMKLGFLTEAQVDGSYGGATAEAVKAYQRFAGLKDSGIANIQMQKALDQDVADALFADPRSWLVQDDGDDDDFGTLTLTDFSSFTMPAAAEEEEDDIPFADTAELETDSVEVDLDDETPDWF